jgi:transposase
MSDCFVHELELEVYEEERSILNTRFISGAMLYNGCLQECLKRCQLMQQSQEYQKARRLPKQTAERKQLFRKAIERHGFDEYKIHRWLTQYLKTFPFYEHLDSTICQKLASRAFIATRDFSVGLRGRPRFKNTKRMRSLEGKSNATGIRFKEGMILWKGLKLKPIYDLKDPDGVEAHALSCRIKYVRMIRKTVKGKIYYFAQLILEGKPLSTKTTLDAVVGIDLGPSTVAVVSENDASLSMITPMRDKSSRRLQRKIARSRELHKITTHRARKLYSNLAEVKRKEAMTRKKMLGKKVNEILAFGNIIKIEKLSYKAFQRCFGKSVGRHAPGMFVEKLRHRAENAGGKFIEINPYKTRLSQVCHGCGREEKKPLSQRLHRCPCGIEMQRDLYSAFLAVHVAEDHLDRSQAQDAWPGAQALLRQAVSRCQETARDEPELVRFGLKKTELFAC